MPVRRLPGSFVATRAITASGHAIARGATVTTANAVAWFGKSLDAYISRGWIIPATKAYVQTARRNVTALKLRHYTPVHLNPTERRSIS